MTYDRDFGRDVEQVTISSDADSFGDACQWALERSVQFDLGVEECTIEPASIQTMEGNRFHVTITGLRSASVAGQLPDPTD